ncbi:hypothetical protein Lal_00034254 [Lupinus albus]|uniref:Uncharacterized protein n=1 Tax=Lupinus albus TaxID=3870 RepID=A0A6A4QXF3_LUPAL|nr:hypothetical protein Lalb_Chr03g0037101 [Lupinus albus]KAF1896556.1 hypothetical protein Lal_00034254 [Lupinus albus]
MANAKKRKSNFETHEQHLSKMQSRAPPPLQINHNMNGKVIIPLLSPIILSSPPSPHQVKVEEPPPPSGSSGEQGKVDFKKWQNPAEPFYYNPTKEGTHFR